MPVMLEISYLSEEPCTELLPPQADALVRATERMLVSMGLAAWEVSLTLCDDRTMRNMNNRHRGVDATTDVLAFPMHEPFCPSLEQALPSGAALLGDVVISVQTAAKQAREQCHALFYELVRLCAHALLHLIGLDHRNRNEERRMTARTDLLCAAAAVSPRVRSEDA